MNHVQEKLGAAPEVTSASTVAATYDSAVTAGNLLWCYCTFGADVNPTCSDSVNGAWTAGPRVYSAGLDQGMQMFFLAATASGTPTVTVSFGSTIGWRGVHIFEALNPNATQPDVAGTGQIQTAPGTGTDATTSTAITTVTDGAFIVGASIDIESTAQPNAGTGFTGLSGWASGVGSRAEYRTQTSAGSVAATFTATDGGRVHETMVMAFRPAAAGDNQNTIAWIRA